MEQMGRAAQNKILRDYKCPNCGYFESFDPECPSCGCCDVKVVILKAPSIRTSTSATVQYGQDEFKFDFVNAANSNKKTIDVIGNELFREGDPRPKPGRQSGMAWGEQGWARMQAQNPMFKNVRIDPQKMREQFTGDPKGKARLDPSDPFRLPGR